MNRTRICLIATALPVLVLACAAPAQTVQTPTRRGYTEADVKFMQGMISHHAQAIEMAAMVDERTSRPDMKLLAERITISQRDEIARMTNWLKTRKEEVPADDVHMHAAMGHGELMPGMLNQEELTQLLKAKGVEFDRLFLQKMIKHHEGALVMVAKLLGTPGAGQEPELYLFANDVDADQRAEIKRMRTVLASLQ